MEPQRSTAGQGSATAQADDCRVQLRAARIPVVGWFAYHHWFVVERRGRPTRWEVWQFARAGGTAWGHLHRDLLPPTRGVGNGPSWVVASWRGEPARELAEAIAASPATYPFCEHYRLWPGPNSNTYVQWILGDRFRLGRKAVGRAFAWRRRERAAARDLARSFNAKH